MKKQENGIKPISIGEMQEATRERLYEISREFSQGFKFLEQYPKSVTFFGSTRFADDHPYYIKARNLASRIVKELNYSVVSGGGPGIMEAANRGAKESGGNSIGLTIRLPKEQVMNNYLTNHIDFYYFFSRKVCLAYSAEAFLFFPGGFGTFDEFTEILTLLQTKKIPKVPVILVGKDYWQDVEAFIEKTLLEKNGTIEKADLKLFEIIDDEDEIIKKIKEAPIREMMPYDGLKVNPIDEAPSQGKEPPLYQKHCVPCEGNVPAFSKPKNLEYLKKVNEWQLIEDKAIEKIFLFKDFQQAFMFMQKVAEIAESENHHPDILLFGWNKVKLSLSTHAIGGLSDNDFILASKIDQIKI